MKSRGFKYKKEVLDLRKNGVSMTVIEREFDIPRSTLSGWFKDIKLTEKQRTRLMKNSQDGWKKARQNAVLSKNIAKAKRIAKAEHDAISVHKSLPNNSEPILELAIAMLYFGEGSKQNTTSMGASDPFMIKFFITSVEKLYSLNREDFRYDLHLRDDHDENKMKRYWSDELNIPIEKIGYVAKDKRTKGKPTRNNYPGVCLVSIGRIDIQRKLKALYTVYCSEVIKGD